ncbi:alpha-1-acid glycoprotein 1-like isoform X1 [Cavia porcellus]|uniref:alpha-1-acid glycoprotein 1-like isoform X1 n=1 Tax=Cavia porcellus TaxID=10141 RepID=UPI00022B7423|nr:alpha-1-acid glycoprotein 1-like [Cavia porcellus]
MALHWALEALCLLPLLNPKDPACANVTAMPITSATLDWLNRRWFYAAGAFRKPEYKQEVQALQADFFEFNTHPREDTVTLQEHMTVHDHCIQNSTLLTVQRNNGTLARTVKNELHLAHLLLLRDPHSFMLGFYLNDEQNVGLALHTDKPEATPEQLDEFREAIKCVGLSTSEILYVDWKKNKCELPEQQETKGKET